jgi:hypothetical protein
MGLWYYSSMKKYFVILAITFLSVFCKTTGSTNIAADPVNKVFVESEVAEENFSVESLLQNSN